MYSRYNESMETKKGKLKKAFKSLYEDIKWISAICVENDLLVYSGHASLLIITAAFPFLTLIVSILNNMPQYSPQDLIDLINSILPDLPEIHSLVSRMIYNLKAQSSPFVTGVSLVITLWFASSGVSAIQAGMKRITLNSDRSRWDKPIALLYMFIFMAMILAQLVFQVFSNSITDAAEAIAGDGAPWISKMLEVFSLGELITNILLFFVILITYTYLPGGRRKLRDQIPGAFLAAVVSIVVSRAFAYFIPRLWTSSVLYGSLAALFLLIMWLRIIMYVLFVGQVINTVLKLKRDMNSVY